MENYPVKQLFIGKNPIEAFQIVYDGSTIAREAADDLANHIQKTCGAQLSVGTESRGEFEIQVGALPNQPERVKEIKATLCNDGILFWAKDGGKVLVLDGQTELGISYAVTKFMEQYLGWHFYTENLECVDSADTLTVPGDLSYSYSPTFKFRHTDWGIPNSQRRRWGLNLGESRAYDIIGFAHTFGSLSGEYDNQPCLTDDAVFETVLKNVKNWIEANPGCRIVSVTQNDNQRYCTCPRCAAQAEKIGQSGLMVNFLNRLGEAIEPEYPDVDLLTFAYQYTRKPPLDPSVCPRSNVVIWLCSIECSFSRTFDDPDCERNKEFLADLNEWGRRAQKLFIWDYTTDFHHYNAPFPNLKVIRRDIELFALNHTIGCYEEGGYQQRENGEFSHLRSFLLSQLLWDPYMTEEHYEALMNGFLQAYYGKGWQLIREYIDKTSEKARNVNILINTDRDIFMTDDGKQDYAFARAMDELLTRAEMLADTPETLQHCAAARCQIDFILANCLAYLDNQEVCHGAPDKIANMKFVNSLKRAGSHRLTESGSTLEIVDELTCELVPPHEWNALVDVKWRASRGLKELK